MPRHAAGQEVAVTLIVWLGTKCCRPLQDGDWCTAGGSARTSPGHRAETAMAHEPQGSGGGLGEQKSCLLLPRSRPCPSHLPGVAREGRGTHRQFLKL